MRDFGKSNFGESVTLVDRQFFNQVLRKPGNIITDNLIGVAFCLIAFRRKKSLSYCPCHFLHSMHFDNPNPALSHSE